MCPPQVFIDQWNTTCGTYGRYNPATGYFELNGLTDITYEEAMLIYKKSPNAYMPYGCQGVLIRTCLPLTRIQNPADPEQSMFEDCKKLEVVDALGPVFLRADNTFYNCINLKRINHIIDRDKNMPSIFFHQCLRLEDIKLRIRGGDRFDLSQCPQLSCLSCQLIVNYAVNTTAIIVTVHPDVYAKLTDETNTPWHQVLISAAEKDINFATP